MKIDNVQLGTVIAALRTYQCALEDGHILNDEISTNGGEFPALSSEEIDLLCVMLNSDANESFDSAARAYVRPEHLTFIRNIAFMSKVGEGDGEIELHDTMNSLITQARTLLNIIPGHIAPSHD